jgi:hypothetical protein
MDYLFISENTDDLAKLVRKKQVVQNVLQRLNKEMKHALRLEADQKSRKQENQKESPKKRLKLIVLISDHFRKLFFKLV